jgi:uncharacterized protein (TIGR03083 family)
MEIQDIYAAQQAGLCALVLEHADRSTDRVPACPDWRVRDVLAHVSGLARDVVTGNLPTMDLLEQWRDDEVAGTRDSMTAEQVGRTSDRSVGSLAADWGESTAALLPMLSGTVPFPEPAPFGLGAILVTDLAIHDQDVRTALGVPRGPDGPAHSLALAAYGFGVDYRIRQLGLGALGLRYGDSVRVLGVGEPAATVAADQFELLRAFGGRRSRAQIRAYEWEGDPEPYLSIIPAYGERAEDLVD